ncbi:hypothetical protein D3G39_10540 [Escherichia coli]|nr:hypothetical protein [Escherichia coli]EFA4517935.1 hypothetical protein [Escherichia coli]EFD4922261.1 hypothetical protein [Escherichia coli]EFN9646585.1 hypothetical protein [Escherichia coli]EFN9723003.1 hypothetical protein [Escherichia coli]
MPELKKRLAQQIAQEVAQTAEREKIKIFRLGQFLKTHKAVKRCPYIFQMARRNDCKAQE